MNYYGCPNGIADVFEDPRSIDADPIPTPLDQARDEILNGLTLLEYLRRTGDDGIDEWAGILAEFGSK